MVQLEADRWGRVGNDLATKSEKEKLSKVLGILTVYGFDLLTSQAIAIAVDVDVDVDVM